MILEPPTPMNAEREDKHLPKRPVARAFDRPNSPTIDCTNSRDERTSFESAALLYRYLRSDPIEPLWGGTNRVFSATVLVLRSGEDPVFAGSLLVHN